MDFNTKQIDGLHNQLRDYLGATICSALVDPTVTEIKCSEDGKIWVTLHQKGWVDTQGFLPEHQRIHAINTMASLLGKTCNADSPDLSGELPLTGDRVSASVPPSGLPAFFIRRHAPQVFEFHDYIDKGIIRIWQIDVLLRHIRQRSNIVFSGATNSGKTTLLNTCLGVLKDSHEHIVIIEDTKEIRFEGRNFSRFNVTEKLSMRHQIKESMRRKPDRLIIGETRDEAGIELLRAAGTGHSIMTTVHADSAAGVLDRFAEFAEEAGRRIPPWRLIRRSIDLICHMEMVGTERRLTQLMEVQKDDIANEIPIRLKQIDENSLTN